MKFSLLTKIELTEEACTQIGDMYTACGWGSRYDWQTIQKAMKNTGYYLAALDESGKIVGMLKAYTDTVFLTYLSELIVDVSAQKKGIGTAMLKKFTEDFAHTAVYVDAYAGTEKMFEKAGLKKREILVPYTRKALHWGC